MKTMQRVTVTYDEVNRKMLITPDGGEVRKATCVLLQDAETVIKEIPIPHTTQKSYHYLLRGHEVRENIEMQIGKTVMEGQPITWNGRWFLTLNSKRVVSASQIVVCDKVMIGAGIQTVE